MQHYIVNFDITTKRLIADAFKIKLLLSHT
jgi:hypothetical protein